VLHDSVIAMFYRAGFKGGPGGAGTTPATNRGPPTKPFMFYFSLKIDAYETTTYSCRALLMVVLVRPNFCSAGPQSSHQLNPALMF